MPPHEPLVTCVVIFLDGERFLGEAIESILGQTYSNVEVMLVDDGSRDGSATIARRYVADPRVSYLTHPGGVNRGMSASRNLGARAGTGELIAFMDCDDVWEPSKLHEQVAVLAAHPRAAMVFGKARRWYGWTGSADDIARDDDLPHWPVTDTLVEPPELLVGMLRSEEFVPSPSSVLVRRTTFDVVGGFEEEFPLMYEDMVFYAKVWASSPVYVSSRTWIRYRRHEWSGTAQALRDGTLAGADEPSVDRRRFLEWTQRFADSLDPRLPAVDASLRRAWRPFRWPAFDALRRRVRCTAGRLRRRVSGRRR